MLLLPNARGPSSAGPARKITGWLLARMVASSCILHGAASQSGGTSLGCRAGPLYTDHSSGTKPLSATIAQQAAPIAEPLSFGKGGTQTASNRPDARSALFHLMLR